MKYQIEQVGPSRQITTKYGPRNVYSVKFQQDPNWTDIMQKPELPPPTMGQEMDGEIEKTQYGYTFKKPSSFGGSVRPQGGSNRQVALQAAVRVSTTGEEALTNAEKFLAWLDATPPATTTPSTVLPTQQDEQPPASNYDGLGL